MTPLMLGTFPEQGESVRRMQHYNGGMLPSTIGIDV